MKKILFIAVGSEGLYSHRQELIKALIADGYSVSLVASPGIGKSDLVEFGCKFIDNPVDNHSKNPLTDLNLLKRLRAAIRMENPDVVLTFYTKTNIWGGIAARLEGVPYITNITGIGMAIENGGLMQKLMLSLYRYAMGKVSCLFYQNQANMNLFKRQNIRPEIGILLPGSGVSLDRFKAMDYPSDENGVEFIFISRILKAKGIDQYLEAAKKIKKQHPETKFHVVGGANDEYLNILQDLDNQKIIEYHGEQKDVRPFLEKAHCMVYPSYYAEGMSNVLLECSASARPVITTARPGCGETVEDGRTGFVVRERDTDDVVAAIERFIALNNAERKEMGLAARRKMEQEFDRQIIVNAYRHEISKILS